MSMQLQIFEPDRGVYVDRASSVEPEATDLLLRYARDSLGSRSHRVVDSDRPEPLPVTFKIPAWQRTTKRARVPLPSPEAVACRAADYYWSQHMPSQHEATGAQVNVHYWAPGTGPGAGTARRYLEELQTKLGTRVDRDSWVHWIELDPTAPGAAFGPDDSPTLDAT